PTFPVNNKKPAVKRFLERKHERWWLDKFGHCNGIGFANGELSGLFVVDLDSTEPAIVREGFRLFGETPIIIQSGSGKFQAWYKWTPQCPPRRIRPLGNDLPIDLLGKGGFTVAPPSAGRIRDYGFIAGGLADLGRLPAPCIPEELLVSRRTAAADE